MTAVATPALFSRFDILRLAPLFRVQARDGRELPPHLDTLHHRMASEPERAPCEMPPDVVTMNSLVRLRDCGHGKLAEYIRSNTFDTVAGKVAFGKDGEWAQSRMVFTQFRDVGQSDIMQFKDVDRQVVVWPKEHATGEFIYPYEKAKAAKASK